jgi:isocitrate dehydrogenase kinase/phosphatase
MPCSANAPAPRSGISRPANWLAIQHVAGDRIDFYDRRVLETAAKIEREHRHAGDDGADGERSGRGSSCDFIGLLIDHKQPECAETFFNSVSVKTLRRTYYHNRFIFVRPTISTEHIDADPPSYRSYYPLQQGLRHALIDIILDFGFERRFADFRRRPAQRAAAFRRRFPRPFLLEANHQIQVLSSPFFRNQTAYIVGRVVNGGETHPFVVPVKHDAAGKLYFDALSWTTSSSRLFSGQSRLFPRRHGSAVGVRRLPARDPAGQDGGGALHDGGAAESRQEPLLPRLPPPPEALARQVHHRARHQGPRDDGVHAAVVSVRVQGDPRQDRGVEGHRPAKVKAKYWLVKHHDRVGRMTDILEYSDVAFPRERFSDELLAELSAVAPRCSSSSAITSSSATSTSSGG